MLFARVVGNVVSTLKDEKLVGRKLLIVEPANAQGQGKGNPIVAVDAVGAGEGELVLIVQGSSARQTARTEGNPVDCTIIGIVDHVELGGKAVFNKREDSVGRALKTSGGGTSSPEGSVAR